VRVAGDGQPRAGPGQASAAGGESCDESEAACLCDTSPYPCRPCEGEAKSQRAVLRYAVACHFVSSDNLDGSSVKPVTNPFVGICWRCRSLVWAQ